MDDFGWRHMNLQRTETFLFSLVRNLCVAHLLAVADVAAIEIIVVDLEQIVIVRVSIVDHPLQAVPFRQHGRKYEGTRHRRDTIKNVVATFTNEYTIFLFPTRRV